MTFERRFLEVAEALCAQDREHPEAFMRRAASTAYYAAFHALCRLCADELIGPETALRSAWQRVYRSLDHRQMRDALLQADARALDPRFASFGRTFAELQERRQAADYDPTFPFFGDEARALVAQAGNALDLLEALAAHHRKLLAAIILFRRRT